MRMRMRYRLFIGLLAVFTGYSAPLIAADSINGSDTKLSSKEQKVAIYAHMKHYGINREDIEKLRQLRSNPHINVAAEDLLNPGEYFRIELDEYTLSMKLPEGNPVPGNWIWPYNNTRTPTPEMKKKLEHPGMDKGRLKVADLGWYVCNGGMLMGLISGRCDTSGVSMRYSILTPEEKEALSTPEKHLRHAQRYLENLMIQERDYAASRGGTGAATRIYVAPEIVVVNGRIWIHYVLDFEMRRTHFYLTTLASDRRLLVTFGIPGIDHNVSDDPANYSAPTRRGMAIMETMLPSLRIVKTNDDGSPDPFVVERVELGPLPVREKLPDAQ